MTAAQLWRLRVLREREQTIQRIGTVPLHIHGIDLVPHIRHLMTTAHVRESRLVNWDWTGAVGGEPKIKILHRHRRYNLHGSAWWHSGRILLNEMPGNDAFDSLATLVHEVAHLTAPQHESHGRTWRRHFETLAWQCYGADIRAKRLHDTGDSGLAHILRRRHREGGLFMAVGTMQSALGNSTAISSAFVTVAS